MPQPSQYFDDPVYTYNYITVLISLHQKHSKSSTFRGASQSWSIHLDTPKALKILRFQGRTFFLVAKYYRESYMINLDTQLQDIMTSLNPQIILAVK